MLASDETDRFFAAQGDLAEVQTQLLLETIVTPNARSAYGRDCHFSAVTDPDDFRRLVPLVDYEQLRPAVERMARGEDGVLTVERPTAFFKTSGSLAAPKLVPVTPSLIRDKARAFGIFWHLIHQAHPALKTGKWIANFGDAGRSERSAGGLDVASETTFWNRRMQGLQSWSGWPLPPVLRTLEDADLRYFTVARLAMAGPLHGIMCLNPSTLLLLCRTMERHRALLIRAIADGELGYPGVVPSDKADQLRPYLRADPVRARQLERDLAGATSLELARVWRELELVVCWQSEIVTPYLRQLEPYLVGVGRRDYITQASECIMAIPAADGSSGGQLAYTSHFFEFIPEESIGSPSPVTRLAWQLEAGRVYELVVTTSGGLYRYRIGDCFRVNGFSGQVPVVEFLYRTGKTSSITGEKLTEYQVLEAARRAAAGGAVAPGEFLCFPRSGPEPHYGLLLSWPGGSASGDVTAPAGPLERWLARFDAQLMAINAEYGDKRSSGRLGGVVGLVVEEGGFDAYRRALAQAGVSEDQVKLGVLSRKLDLDAVLPVQRAIHARDGL
jgi:hypothetical protein